MAVRSPLTLDRKLGPLAGVLVILVSGCGTGEYERRMEKRVTELRQVAKFNALYAPVALEGTPVLVRVPQTFKTQLVVGTTVEEKLVDARRAGIPFLPLSSKKAEQAKPLVYEALVPDATGGKQPFYIYLTAVTGKEAEALRGPSQDRMDDAGALSTALQKAFPGKGGTWEDASYPSPGGGNLPWQKLRVEGDQEFFYVDAQGKDQFHTYPGVIEIYARTEGDYLVLVIWRMPLALEAASEVARLAPLVCGSLSRGG